MLIYVYCTLIHGISFIHSFIHLRVINTSGIECCSGGEAVTSYNVWHAWGVSYVLAFIDYLSIIFYVFIYLFIENDIFETWGKERNRIQGFCHQKTSKLIFIYCFHADKLSFTCSSGSWDSKNASRQNISSGKSSTRS